jgi:hypothetical protein
VTVDLRSATGAAYHIIEPTGATIGRSRPEIFAAVRPYAPRAGRTVADCETRRDECFEEVVAWRISQAGKAFANAAARSVYALTLEALGRAPTSDVPLAERDHALTLRELQALPSSSARGALLRRLGTRLFAAVAWRTAPPSLVRSFRASVQRPRIRRGMRNCYVSSTIRREHPCTS